MKLYYKRADRSMAKEMAEFQADVFLEREPMTMCLGFSRDEYVSYMTKLYEATIEDTLSFVVFDGDADKLVGALVALDCCMGQIDIDFNEKEQRVIELSNSFFALFDDALAEYKIEKPLDACLMSYVAVQKDYLRLGIMSKLIEMVEKAMKAAGYKYAIVYATNYKSAGGLDKNAAFRRLKSVAYRDCGIDAFADAPGECILYLARVAEIKSKDMGE